MTHTASRCGLRSPLLVLASCVLFGALTASALRIGVAVPPMIGHVTPMLSIAEYAVRANHSVDILTGNMHAECRDAIAHLPPEHIRCVDVGVNANRTEFNEDFWEQMTQRPAIEGFGGVLAEMSNEFNRRALPLLIDAIQTPDGAPRYDVLLVDVCVEAAVWAADFANIPVVVVWPLALTLPTETDASYPSMLTPFPAQMSVVQRLVNYLLRQLVLSALWRHHHSFINPLRAEYGLAPLDPYDLYYRRMMLTPSIPGLDTPQPLCPNVVPLGFMLPEVRSSGSELGEEWEQWLGMCEGSGRPVAYVNLGSLAVLPQKWNDDFMAAFRTLTERGYCVLYKHKSTRYHDAALAAAASDRGTAADREALKVVKWIKASPRHLLRSGRIAVFMTHCGDTSVAESIEAGVPLVGFGLFSDQPYVCARVADSGIGVVIDKLAFTSHDLVTAIQTVATDAGFKRRVEGLRRAGLAMGGPRAGLAIVERVAARDSPMPFCRTVNLPWYQFYNLDVIGLTLGGAFVVLKTVLLLFKLALRWVLPSQRV